jgi:hypothetical protein
VRSRSRSAANSSAWLSTSARLGRDGRNARTATRPAPANALTYRWNHFIGGHLGRLGTRDDVTLHQQYMADIAASVTTAIDSVDPTPYFVKYGENAWAAVKGYLDAVSDTAARPVIERYTGDLAAADVFTVSTTFWVMESIRLDLGYGSQVHP